MRPLWSPVPAGSPILLGSGLLWLDPGADLQHYRHTHTHTHTPHTVTKQHHASKAEVRQRTQSPGVWYQMVTKHGERFGTSVMDGASLLLVYTRRFEQLHFAALLLL